MIRIDNPKLQKQIDALQAERDDLQAKLAAAEEERAMAEGFLNSNANIARRALEERDLLKATVTNLLTVIGWDNPEPVVVAARELIESSSR